jgi:hypothetical protein
MKIELGCCEATLLREIADRHFKRNDVAKTYRLALASSERDQIDWRKVNQAIIKRWSPHALAWIKSRAWSGRCFVGRQNFHPPKEPG